MNGPFFPLVPVLQATFSIFAGFNPATKAEEGAALEEGPPGFGRSGRSLDVLLVAVDVIDLGDDLDEVVE